MPIIERDPWRMQYFENVECPDDVIIPTDDEHAYELYPEYRWIYNKLLICDTQGVEGAPHGVPPRRFPVFSKPIYNMHGMGVGGRLISDRETLAANLTAGHMWMELMEGEHISSVQITFRDDIPLEQHAMPPGGFRLAVVNCMDLDAGLRARTGDRIPAGGAALVGPLAARAGYGDHVRAHAAGVDAGVGDARAISPNPPRGRWVAERVWPSTHVRLMTLHLRATPSMEAKPDITEIENELGAFHLQALQHVGMIVPIIKGKARNCVKSRL